MATDTIEQALSSSTSRSILEVLSAQPQSSAVLAAHFSISQPAMSRHLAVLEVAKLVAKAGYGPSVAYRVQGDRLAAALTAFPPQS